MRVIVIFAAVFSLYQSTMAHAIDNCLRLIVTKSDIHRIDKEDGIKNCFEINKAILTKEVCYQKAEIIKNTIHSSRLHSKILNTCFYDVGIFTNVKNCLAATRNFQLANDHDDAVFYCYQSFQESINQTSCLNVANELIFPMKKDYLKRHCLQN